MRFNREKSSGYPVRVETPTLGNVVSVGLVLLGDVALSEGEVQTLVAGVVGFSLVETGASKVLSGRVHFSQGVWLML